MKTYWFSVYKDGQGFRNKVAQLEIACHAETVELLRCALLRSYDASYVAADLKVVPS